MSALLVREKRRGVEAIDPEARHDRIGGAATVRPDYLAPLRVPEHEVKIVRIEPVEVDPLSRPLADRAERQLAKSPDLVEQVRDRIGVGQERDERAGPRQHGRSGELPNLACEFAAIGGRGDRLGRDTG